MQLLIDPFSDGTVTIWKDYQPPWSALLQSSTNLGQTWTDLGISTNGVWTVTPDTTSPQIYRAVKVD